MQNFVQKKIIYFEWKSNVVQNWFSTDIKMKRNFMQKKSSLGFMIRGNPSSSLLYKHLTYFIILIEK